MAKNSSNVGNPIYTLGQELILEFTEALSSRISIFLSSTWGENWVEECTIQDSSANQIRITDLNFILRQTLDLNNHNFRIAIAKEFMSRNMLEKSHLQSLEMIRKSRNLWAHPDRVLGLRDLHLLAMNISVFVQNGESLGTKCREIMSLSMKEEHLNAIANITKISRDYQHSIEYRSELAKTLKEFAKRAESNNNDGNFKRHYMSVIHTSENLWINFLILQSLYYQLLFDRLAEIREPRTGRLKISSEILDKLYRDLDTKKALSFAKDYATKIANDETRNNCDCDFCELFESSGFVELKEQSQLEVENYYSQLNGISKSFEKEIDPGRLPSLVLFISVVIVAKSGIDASKVLSEWNFELINTTLELGNKLLENEAVLEYLIKAIAISNGIPTNVVNKWVIYD